MPFSNLNAPTAALRICVEEAVPGHISGRVYGQRLTEAMPFSDLGALLLRLDEVLDKQNFPQAFQRPRSFADRESGVPAAATPEEGMPAEAVAAAVGKLATFDLYITSRRNSSWQGTVARLEGGGAREFTSALELMRLLEEQI